MRGRMLVGCIVVAVAFGAGVAVASIPSGNGTILGCYDPGKSGPPYPLSVVDSPKSCPSPAVLLPFSQKGPVGPTGPAGHLGGVVASRLQRELAVVSSQLERAGTELARQVRQEHRIFGLEQRFVASHLPDFGAVTRKLRQIVGARAARQLLSEVPMPRARSSVRWGRAGSDLKRGLDSQSELSELEALRLQMAMDRESKFEASLSNLLKKLADTEAAIIQNLK